MEQVILTQEREGILELVFNRPAKYNALSDEMINGIDRAVERFASQPELRVMLIRANGRYFSAGVDINPQISPSVGGSTLDGRHWYREEISPNLR